MDNPLNTVIGRLMLTADEWRELQSGRRPMRGNALIHKLQTRSVYTSEYGSAIIGLKVRLKNGCDLFFFLFFIALD